MICGSRVVATRHTEAYSLSSPSRSLAFIAMSFIKHLEPPFLHILAFKAIVLHFSVQNHYFFSVSAFRVTISSQFERSEPPSLFNLAFRATIHSQLWHSEPSSLYSLTFRATIFSQLRHSKFGVQSRPSQFGVQSHVLSLVIRVAFLVWHSESLFPHSLAFRAVILSQSGIHRHIFGIQIYILSVQSCQFSLTFRAINSQFGAQSHYLFPVLRSEPPSLLSLGIQSHHLFSVWRSEPPSLLSYGIQSHHLFTARRSKPPYFLSYDVQSHPSQFGVQSHVFSLVFRVASPVWCSESLFPHSLAFRVIILSRLSIHRHIFNV